MRLIGLAVALAASVVVAACSADLQQIRMREAWEMREVWERELEEVPDLTPEERHLLVHLLMKRRYEYPRPLPWAEEFGTISVVVTALREVPPSTRAKVEAYDNRRSEGMRLVMEVMNQEDARARELRTAIYLGVSVKGFESESNSLTIECLYENASGKDIGLFTGILQFSDSFDRPMFQSYLTIAEPIPAGETAKWVGQVDANRLVTPQIDRIVWHTRSIVYADGTIVGASNAAQ
jgi:hypothetical protein